MKKYKIALLLVAGLALASCDKLLLGEKEANNPVNNFDVLWGDFDKMYGGFAVKDVDWDSLCNVYRPLVNETTTDVELFHVFSSLLDNLDDNHVTLIPVNTGLPSYQSGIVGRLKTFSDFSLSAIANNYLDSIIRYSGTILYGRLKENVGYIVLGGMEEGIDNYEKAFDYLFEYFKNTEGLVVDIRNNPGGNDQESVYIAGRFVEDTKTGFKFRLKNGPGHQDFTPFYEYTIRPTGKSRYSKGVVVLTHRFTISAAETFAMAMSLNEHVTLVGDTTSGAFSDMNSRELPNGWVYTISIGDWRASDGTSYEGVGFPPDIVVQNDSADVAAGRDEALEKAISILKQKK
jgi:carboxyl-terminal processing protease